MKTTFVNNGYQVDVEKKKEAKFITAAEQYSCAKWSFHLKM